MENVKLKDTFQNVVEVYDRARPKYPKELLKDVLDFANTSSFEVGLEVGAGTGQATELFLKEVRKLDIVEVGDKQVDFLNDRYGNENVCAYKSYFEEYSTERKYNLIYSATAFHWVDASVGYPKAWKMLEENGVLAVFWHMSSVTYHKDGVFSLLNEIQQKFLPNETLGFDKEGIEGVRQRRISQIQSGGFFSSPVIKEYRWTDRYEADRYALLIESYSSTQTLSVKKKEEYLCEIKRCINDNGGFIDLPQHVMLYMVKKC